jgi:hypothetical protein
LQRRESEGTPVVAGINGRVSTSNRRRARVALRKEVVDGRSAVGTGRGEQVHEFAGTRVEG